MNTQSLAYEIRLLGGFALLADDAPVTVAPGSQRVLSFLALHDRPVVRSWVASSLWPETTDERAAANLRSALWRLHEAGHRIVVGSTYLAVRDEVRVDVRDLAAAARRLRVTGELPSIDVVERTSGELLPGCWEPWVEIDRERIRLEQIHLCGVVASAALDRGDAHLAAMAALSALACDPLCEPSHHFLIRAHLASGRRIEANRAFDRYAEIVRRELGIEPSRSFAGLAAV